MPACIQVLLNAIIAFILGLFLKNYLPSYMEKNGKNLATKEDIQDITKLTESVKAEFERDREAFSTDLQFKYKYYYEQYDQLYSYLYACVTQSEYVRYYLEKVNGQEASFDEFPFIEITPRHRHKVRTVLREDGKREISSSEEEIETPVSKMNIDNLVDYIIENGALAEQRLIKYSLAYRLVKEVSAKDDESAQDEMIKHQKIIVHEIVRTYNFLRKELKMTFDKDELETGLLDFGKDIT